MNKLFIATIFVLSVALSSSLPQPKNEESYWKKFGCRIVDRTYVRSTEKLNELKEHFKSSIKNLHNEATKQHQSEKRLEDKFKRLLDQIHNNKKRLFATADVTISHCKDFNKWMAKESATKEEFLSLVKGIKAGHGKGLLESTEKLMKDTLQQIAQAQKESKERDAEVEKLLHDSFNIKASVKKSSEEARRESAETSGKTSWTATALQWVSLLVSDEAGCKSDVINDTDDLVDLFENHEAAELDAIDAEFRTIQKETLDLQNKLIVDKTKLKQDAEILTQWKTRSAAVIDKLDSIDTGLVRRIKTNIKTISKVNMCSLMEAATNWNLRKGVNYNSLETQPTRKKTCEFDRSSKKCQCT